MFENIHWTNMKEIKAESQDPAIHYPANLLLHFGDFNKLVKK